MGMVREKRLDAIFVLYTFRFQLDYNNRGKLIKRLTRPIGCLMMMAVFTMHVAMLQFFGRRWSNVHHRAGKAQVLTG